MESKIKHLEFIQNVITRMNTNSFMIKGWAITIVSAIFVIYVSTQNVYFILVCVLPIILFWFLDAYYLTQERLFRCLYKKAIEEGSTIIEFDMKIPTECKNVSKNKYLCVFFSKTIWPLYFSILIIVLIVFFGLKMFNCQLKKQNPIQIEIKDTIKIKNITSGIINLDSLSKK